MQKVQEIINSYSTTQPMQTHLRAYFKAHKEMGSRDRKVYTQLVYGYYRLKGNRPHADGWIVKAAAHDTLLHAFYTFWQDKIDLPEEEDASGYFPLWDQVTNQIDTLAFIQALHQQPAVFIRCKKEAIKSVIDELTSLNYTFERDGVSIRFTQNYPLQDTQSFAAGLFEIQDIASQSTRRFFQPAKNEAWWDCCAGSGGKSLLLLEEEKQIQLFVSDSRESILRNLQERFQRAGIRQYAAIIADLTQTDAAMLSSIPDMQGIIADVPCSGSGTWARTPERLSFFSQQDLDAFVQLQRTIVSQAVSKLLPGGKLIYLTCSVYKKENEDQVAWISKTFSLQLQEQAYLSFAPVGGDTLFGAVFIR